MSQREDFLHVVGDIYSEQQIGSILSTNPIIYYKDDKPYGFISIVPFRKGVMILSATKDNSPFLRRMIKFIYDIAYDCIVYILHNRNRSDISDNIIRVFSKKFRTKQLKTNYGVLTIGRRK